MTLRKCKFCGCSERRPCSVLVRFTDIDNFELLFQAVQEFSPAIRAVPCLAPPRCMYESRVCGEGV
jgi:hypothetical protein